MAITKITNIKANLTGHGARSAHLINALSYIMNKDKTDNGLLVGSNCGSDPKECYDRMMETKRFYGKENGRQGYHVVISFKPHEGTKDLAYRIGQEFCERFFGNDFEYAFAVHNDRAHLHIHIIFNSVNRNDSYKYRYNRGDWEKKMQPVTDDLCRKYGLSVLEYDKVGPRVGEDYAKHMAVKEGRLTWSEIIRRDIDFAISISSNEKEFFDKMRSMGYRIRIGNSRDHGEYVAYTAPGESRRDRDRTHRDYRLGDGYNIKNIRLRLREDEKIMPPPPSPFSEEKIMSDLQFEKPGRKCTIFQIRFLRRRYILDNFHFLDLAEREQAAVRKDLLRLDELTKQCDYILSRDIGSREAAEKRLLEVKEMIQSEKAALSPDKARLKELVEEKHLLTHIIKDSGELIYADDIPFRDDLNFQKALSDINPEEKEIYKGSQNLKGRMITN